MLHGEVSAAIVNVLRNSDRALPIVSISEGVRGIIGDVPASSIRSALNLQTNNPAGHVRRVGRGLYAYRSVAKPQEVTSVFFDEVRLFHGDSMEIMKTMAEESIHAIVTDPPYGLVEFSEKEKEKLRSGRGGVWRIPPTIGGCKRSPLPRFTTLTAKDIDNIDKFFEAFGHLALRVLTPGANLVMASNPLVVHVVTSALACAGLEPRGQIIRLVQTMRGGDRPKGAEETFPDVSVMPRSQWEPWIIMRKPITKTSAASLREYFTGGWRRISDEQPFGDVIKSSPTRPQERQLSNHPSLKPQAFMRQVVRASLPLGKGVILDPFAGGGSTLAAALKLGYAAIGIELDSQYFQAASQGIPKLAALS